MAHEKNEYQPKVEASMEQYNCMEPEEFNATCANVFLDKIEPCTARNISYNDFASLIFVQGEEAIHHLFTRGTHDEISYGACFLMLFIYFIGACWAAGSAVSSGLVVPMLLIGACYGRIIGMICVDLARNSGYGPYPQGSVWAWLDPGVFALIGAASFFGGVTRLTIALTVIMIEISDDVQLLLPIMISIVIAKWIADFITHSLYHAVIELKCMPLIDTAPPAAFRMDNEPISKLMNTPIRTVNKHPTLHEVWSLLTSTNHGGFPVVEETSHGNVIVGLVSRPNLRLLLNHVEFHFEAGQEAPTHIPLYDNVFAGELQTQTQSPLIDAQELEPNNSHDLCVNVTTVMNDSVFTIYDTFSIERAFILFRNMGLRHLPVVDKNNVVVGMLTRKDLLAHEIEEKTGYGHHGHHGHHHESDA
eukprot:m.64518 g.64518  ORF g.64518 m.64518 type:complete len:418 (+) comp13598_c0_seq1:1431-2684(+)